MLSVSRRKRKLLTRNVSKQGGFGGKGKGKGFKISDLRG
jgi:hypothetical protein